MNPALEVLVTSTVESLGYELFELRQKGSTARPMLAVRIDRADGGNVTVGDCAAVSRALQAQPDADGSLGERYALEVSSPGLERPLRDARDWRRFSGRTAVVTSDVVGGTAEVEIVGVEETAKGETAVVRSARGQELKLPLSEVRQARLAFNWKR